MAVPSLHLVESTIRKRAETDQKLSFGAFIIWHIVLGIFTLFVGNIIYHYIINYRLVQRRNEHFNRQRTLLRAAIRCLREANEAKTDERLSAVLDRADAMLNDAQVKEGERNAWLWAIILPIVTLGFAGLYTLWFLTVDYHRHSAWQREFFDTLAEAIRLATGKNVALVDESLVPNRNFWVYLLLTIVTLGFFGFYWTYVLFSDPNKHFEQQAFVEDQMVSYLREL